MKETLINGTWSLILPDHRADRPEWTSKDGWEKARLQSMHENLTGRDTIFYIGAEEGDMAGLCSLWGAEVAMFEPNDRVWPNVKAIWKANDLRRPIFTYSGFASDVSIDVENGLYYGTFPPSADGALISDHGFKELCDPGEIPQIRIDTVVKLTGVKPTALSIDVEGSEWQVLKGAEDTLRDHKPKIWLSVHPEFMFRIYGQYQMELRKWIKDFGYKENLLDYQHELHLFYEPI